MCKNEYEVKMQAMDLMSAAINDVVCAMDAIDKFAEAFGLCEDQEAEREKDLKILIDAVCEQEPGIPKCTVDRVIRTAFDLLEDDEEEDEDARRSYINEKDGPTVEKGTVKREYVSNVEIWSECFGRSPSDMKPADSYSIAALMTQIPGWERSKDCRKKGIYGKQRVYVRTEEQEK